eukprot:g72547.t1
MLQPVDITVHCDNSRVGYDMNTLPYFHEHLSCVAVIVNTFLVVLSLLKFNGFTEKYRWDFREFRGKKGICNWEKVVGKGLQFASSSIMSLHNYFLMKQVENSTQYVSINICTKSLFAKM